MFERFIARNAILRDISVMLGILPPQSAPSAAYTIDAATLVFSCESLVGSHLTFILCQIHELLSDAALLFHRDRSVIDIPASVPCDADVILAAPDLKKAGYRLSLSGWSFGKERRPLSRSL